MFNVTLPPRDPNGKCVVEWFAHRQEYYITVRETGKHIITTNFYRVARNYL